MLLAAGATGFTNFLAKCSSVRNAWAWSRVRGVPGRAGEAVGQVAWNRIGTGHLGAGWNKNNSGHFREEGGPPKKHLEKEFSNHVHRCLQDCRASSGVNGLASGLNLEIVRARRLPSPQVANRDAGGRTSRGSSSGTATGHTPRLVDLHWPRLRGW